MITPELRQIAEEMIAKHGMTEGLKLFTTLYPQVVTKVRESAKEEKNLLEVEFSPELRAEVQGVLDASNAANPDTRYIFGKPYMGKNGRNKDKSVLPITEEGTFNVRLPITISRSNTLELVSLADDIQKTLTRMAVQADILTNLGTMVARLTAEKVEGK